MKVRGLNVGTVSGIELLRDGRARVTLRLDDGVRVPTSAVASIEPLSVFGPKFVRLEPGAGEATGPYLGPGDTIVDTRTSVELTETLDTASRLLDRIDPAELASIVVAVTEGIDGMGPEIGRSIDGAATLAGVAAAHTADLEQFLGDAAVLAGTVAEHADDIVATVEGLSRFLPALLADPDGLGDLLDATTRISTTFSDLLDDHRGEIDVTLIALAGFADGIRQESEHLPDLVDLAGTFFGRLSDVVRMPAAAGAQMAALRGFIALDLCLIVGVCLGPQE